MDLFRASKYCFKKRGTHLIWGEKTFISYGYDHCEHFMDLFRASKYWFKKRGTHLIWGEKTFISYSYCNKGLLYLYALISSLKVKFCLLYYTCGTVTEM